MISLLIISAKTYGYQDCLNSLVRMRSIRSFLYYSQLKPKAQIYQVYSPIKTSLCKCFLLPIFPPTSLASHILSPKFPDSAPPIFCNVHFCVAQLAGVCSKYRGEFKVISKWIISWQVSLAISDWLVVRGLRTRPDLGFWPGQQLLLGISRIRSMMCIQKGPPCNRWWFSFFF